MWIINNSGGLYRLGHIHKDIEIYLFNQDEECPLCKEKVPDYVKVQKSLLNEGKFDQFSTYISNESIYLRPIGELKKSWNRYNIIDKKLRLSNTSSVRDRTTIIELLSDYGYKIMGIK